MSETAPRFAVITGAAGGIGRALVAEFHQAGYRVIATDIANQPAELECDHFIQADLARTVEDAAYADQIFDEIRRLLQGGGLHALINNAAVQILGGVDSLTRQAWRDTLNVNLLAPFLWVQAFLAEMEAVGGCVVNISSIHAKLTKRDFVAYATSKAALSGMTRAMAVDLGPRIRVNAIEPAAVETDMLVAGFGGREDLFRRLADCHPSGCLAQPRQVSRLALTIVQDGMNFMHGACVAFDGGIGGRLFETS